MLRLSPTPTPAEHSPSVVIGREFSPDLEANIALLKKAFPKGYTRDATYLDWLYMRSGGAPALVVSAWKGGAKVGHMVFLPHEFDCDGRRARFGFTADFFVLPEARSGPLMIKLTREAMRLARETGYDGLYGLPNDASLPVVSRFMKPQSSHGLTVTMGLSLPTPGARDVESAWVRDLSDAEAVQWLAPYLVDKPNERIWNPARLLTRLRSPVSQFALHRLPEAMAVSCRFTTRGHDLAMLAAFFSAGSGPINSRSMQKLVRSATATHGTSLFGYVGMNANLERLPGFKLPKRLYPSPFKMVIRTLSDGVTLTPRRYELIDTDIV